MLYNTLGKTGLEVSRLGFGTMRLPTFNSNDEIDTEEASKMLEYGIENGINLIDTAYPYHSKTLEGSGNSERFVGEFLAENNYRDEVYISTKSPSWAIESKNDFQMYLDEQLEKLKTDYIDIYLLHSLNVPDWEKVKNFDVLDFLDDCLSSGTVKHVGFSSHIEIDYLIEIIDEYPKWEVVMTQMNYFDEYYQSGIMGLEYLKEVNIGSMIMEPLRGGRLVNNIPQSVQDIWISHSCHTSIRGWKRGIYHPKSLRNLGRWKFHLDTCFQDHKAGIRDVAGQALALKFSVI